MNIYIKETPDKLYSCAAFKGFKNYFLGIASPSLTHYYQFNGIPENAKYNKRRKCHMVKA